MRKPTERELIKLEKKRKQILAEFKKKFVIFANSSTGKLTEGRVSGAILAKASGNIYLVMFRGKEKFTKLYDKVIVLEGEPKWYAEYKAKLQEELDARKAETVKRLAAKRLENQRLWEERHKAMIGQNNENHRNKENETNELNTNT